MNGSSADIRVSLITGIYLIAIVAFSPKAPAAVQIRNIYRISAGSDSHRFVGLRSF